jgi:hypothetical protein
MKKFVKSFALVMLALVGLVGLTSCGKYNFYKDWTEAGAELEKDAHIFEALTLEEAKAKIEGKETFVLVIGTSQSSTAVHSITTLQSQADYLGYEGKVYFVDSTDYIELRSTRDEVKSALGIKKLSNLSTSDLIVVTYSEGVVKLDTSDSNSEMLEFFQSEFSTLSMEAIAYYLYRDFNQA